jgi:hypothetical protein
MIVAGKSMPKMEAVPKSHYDTAADNSIFFPGKSPTS